MGGTFNPLHNGHLLLADLVKKTLNYDKIIFIPSYIPAHKKVADSVSPEERLYMLIHTLEDYEWADFSDCEIKRKGISYTVDTIEYIRDHYLLSGKPGLIIGDDLALGFQSWRNPEKIVEMTDLIVAHRLYEQKISLDLPHKYIDNDIFTLSSSKLRDMVKNGYDISEYVPDKVYSIIMEKGLYRESHRKS